MEMYYVIAGFLLFSQATAVLGESPWLSDVHEAGRYRDPLLAAAAVSEDVDSPHHRARRALPTDGEVTETTFFMEKGSPFESLTTVNVGHGIPFAMAVQFKPGDNTDMVIELFTPDNDTTVMKLCDVTVSVGSYLTLGEPTPIVPVMEAKTNDSTNYDRAIITLGSVSVGVTGAPSAVDYQVIITWSAVVINNPDTVDNKLYWVSAGAEYNSEMEVWVGQASFTYQDDNYMTLPWDTPTFNFTGPEFPLMGEANIYRVDAYLPYPYVNVAFDAFTPIGTYDVMSICSASLVDTGAYYSCTTQREQFVSVQYPEPDPRGKGNHRSRLDIGGVLNSGSRLPEANKTWEENRLTFEFAVYVYENASLDGQDFWLGAAIEIGTDVIWAGQMNVTVTNGTGLTSDPAYSMPENPEVIMETNLLNGEYEVVTQQTVTYNLHVYVPLYSSAHYELEVLMPFNDSAARMRLCDVRLISTGSNIGCLTENEPVYSNRSEGVADRAVWDLRHITNMNTYTGDTLQNKITFLIVARVVEHPLNVAGEKLWVTAGLKFGSQSIWVGQNAVTFATANTLTADDLAPSFDITYAFLGDGVPVGGVATVHYEVTVAQAAVHTPMDMEIILPFNETAVLSICRVELVHVGSNIPCFDQRAVNESITLHSKNNDTVFDKASVALGTLCNIGNVADNSSGIVVADPRDDMVIIAVTFKVEDHWSLVNGSKEWVSAGIMYSQTKMWVGQIAVYALRDEVITLQPGQTPYTALEKSVNETDDLEPGMAATYYFTVKLPPASRADYNFKATASAGLGICFMKIKEIGWNLACADATTAANYTQHADGSGRNMEGIIYMGPVSNVGDAVDQPVYQDTIFDNNTVVIEVIVSLALDAAGPETLTVGLDIGGVVDQYQQPVTISPLAPTPLTTQNDTIPEINMHIVGINPNSSQTNEVVRGQVVKFYVDVFPAAGSSNRLVVKLLTPVNATGTMQVCDINVIYVGKNIPCLQRKLITPTVIPRTGSLYNDIGTVDLGPVCHFPIYNDTEPGNEDANLIRVEGHAKVMAGDLTPVGSSHWISSTVKINDDNIYVSQLQLSVVDIDMFNDSTHDSAAAYIDANVTVLPIPARPGSLFSVPVVVTVPANASLRVYFDVKLPVNDSAVMTVHHVEVVSAGRNLACLASHAQDEFIPQYNSTEGTTQWDEAFYDLLVVTNTGTTYRMEDYQAGDDDFTVNVQIQMADSVVNIHDSWHWASFGAKMGESVVVVEVKVQVVRDNLEKPDIELTADINSTTAPAVYLDTDALAINATLRHTNESSAEGYNVSATFYVPKFVRFVSVCEINFTMPEVHNVTHGTGVVVLFDRLFFTDIVFFTLCFEMDVGRGMPLSTSDVNATTPYQLGSRMIPRENHTTPDKFFILKVDSLTYRVSGAGGSLTGCTEAELGLVSGTIADCQISGSYSPVASNQPKDVRPGGLGWIPHTRRGPFSKYLQVNFGNMTKVTKVVLTHVTGNFITKYKLLYSLDSISWLKEEEITTSATSVSTDVMAAPVEARYMRLEVLETNALTAAGDDGELQLTLELHGCSTTDDVAPTDVCANPSTWQTNALPPGGLAVYQRGFVATPSGLQYCDVNPKSHKLECYSTTDGIAWMAMDQRVINVLGVDLEDSVVFGLSFDERAVMMSRDNGATWFAVSYERLAEAQMKGAVWVPAVSVSWVVDSSIDPAVSTPTTAYSLSAYGATYDGLYKSGTKVADWTYCCAV